MKYFIATDIHGSIKWFNKLMLAYEKENPDAVIFLGDYYYHGPRNPLPNEYAPMKVADKIIELGDKAVLIKGNCDSEVDEMITSQNFVTEHVVVSKDKTVLFTHGHRVSAYCPTNLPYSAVINGHFHVNDVKEINATKYITIASISLPKEGHKASYAILEDGILTIKDLEGVEILRVEI